MTVYVNDLLKSINKKYGSLSGEDLIKKVFEIGVIDHTLCKVLSVREYVLGRMKEGDKKVDAMWAASEHFCCTYEYIRKCVYYYVDVNL